MKKTMFLILILCLLAAFQSVFADGTGTCGTNVKYTIKGSTINYGKADSGLDAVWEADCKNYVWNDYDITTLNIADSIIVLDAESMFSDLTVLETMNVKKLDVSRVTNMKWMFYDCYSLKSLDLSGWDTSKVTDMSGMFGISENLTAVNLDGWDTSNVTSMSGMFYGCGSLKTVKTSGWDTSTVTTMSEMFSGCSSLRALNVSGWDTSAVTTMFEMFRDCSSLKTLNVSGWNTSKVTTMNGLFEGCRSLQSLDLSRWDTSNVTDMTSLFSNCASLTDLNVSGWNTSKVKSMASAFSVCLSLPELDVNGWDTSNVTTMYGMFTLCRKLESLDLSSWNTAKVTSVSEMFNGCSILTALNLSGWNTSNVEGKDFVFNGCDSLNTLILGKNTLKTNFFKTLPSYSAAWYYVVQGKDAGKPLALKTVKSNESLFKSYKYNTMAGAWSTKKNPGLAEIITINNTAGKNISRQTVKSKTAKYQLSAVVTPAKAAQTVTWSSAQPKVATVSADGKVTFKKAGTVRITAVSTDIGRAESWVRVKLLPKATKIIIKNKSGKAITGKTITIRKAEYQLSASANPAKAEQTVTWKSSDTSVATVSKTGKVTFKKAGSVVIKAISTDRGKKSGRVRLIYKP